MGSPKLLMNGKDYPLKAVKSGEYASGTLTPFERSTLNFCRDWLSGKKQFVFQTSGSTGEPEEIVFDRSQILKSIQRTTKALGLKKGGCSLVCLNTNYVGGKMMLARSIELEKEMYIVEPSSNPFANIGAESKFDFAAFVPMQVQMIIENGNTEELNEIDNIIIGGAPLSARQSEMAKQLHTSSFLTYGMTETLSHVALQRLSPAYEDFFRVLPGVKIFQGGQGELILELPEHPDPIITRDQVKLLSQRQFRWLGRLDHVINTGGIKVHPEKLEYRIEEILHQMNIDVSFFIHGVEDEKFGQKIVLFIEDSKWKQGKTEKIFEQFKKDLKQFEIPKEIRFISEFLYTPTEKIRRAETIKASE